MVSYLVNAWKGIYVKFYEATEVYTHQSVFLFHVPIQLFILQR